MSIQEGLKKTKNLKSLTVTLALAFLALSAGILSTSSGLNIYFRLQTQQKVIDSQQQLIAQEAADAVRDFILEKFNKLEQGVRLGDLGIASQEEQKLVLEKLIGLEPAFRQLVLLNAQGQVVLKVSRLSSFATIQLMEAGGDDLFLEVSKEERYISSVYIDNITCEPLVIMAVPVTDIFGDFKGVLMAEVNLKFMWDLVDSIKVGDTGVAYVVDMEGTLIAFGDTSRVLSGENLTYLDEVDEFVGGNESVHEIKSEISKGIRGDDVVTTHVHLSNPDWAIVVELPVEEAYEDFNQELRLSVLVMVLCFILAVVIGIYLSKRITKPIIKLRDATRKISKGNLDTKIDVKLKGEIGDLATSFNLMTSELKESRQELEGYSRSLEKKVEERTADLARSNAELEQFAYVASHDLQEPLRMVSSYVKLLERRYKDKLDKDADEFIAYAVDGANRMQGLINDLLTYSRVGTKGKPFEPTDSETVFKLATDNLKVAIEESGAVITHDSLPTVMADSSQLIQLLQNLIGNGVKFRGEEPLKINVSAAKKENEWLFSVSDNGIGIDPKDKERIFQIFQRLHNRNEYQGTGIGLAVSKKIVERHGGRIWVESKPKKGSTFYFTIPNIGGERL